MFSKSLFLRGHYKSRLCGKELLSHCLLLPTVGPFIIGSGLSLTVLLRGSQWSPSYELKETKNKFCRSFRKVCGSKQGGHQKPCMSMRFIWMVFYTAFNSISVISPGQFTLFTSFLGFTSTRLGLWSVLPKDTSMKKPRGYSVAWTQDPWITSQTLYHWWGPLSIRFKNPEERG